ncbi:MAG: hypothetical protein F4Y86_16305 [Gammaproteobacteria bacterium]|nr:hypothetical protein [Gammaproteobacteria bacterium]MYB38117.1 hypothetical protein [Gammaproteobacteria bacterium]
MSTAQRLLAGILIACLPGPLALGEGEAADGVSASASTDGIGAALPEADEEMIITADPDDGTAQAIAMMMLDTHLSNERGRQLYLQHRYDEAAPHLLAAAKRGFKMAQARLGEILVLGLGDVEQDVASGMGWMGVAASGTTMPSVKSRLNELRSHVPPELHSRLDGIIAAYTAQFGSEATGVNCLRGKQAGTHLTKIRCNFAEEWKYVTYMGVDAVEELEALGAYGQ